MTQSARQQLVNAKRKNEASNRLEWEARTGMIAAVERAADESVPKTEIAKLAGVSRQTVYDILGSPEEGMGK